MALFERKTEKAVKYKYAKYMSVCVAVILWILSGWWWSTLALDDFECSNGYYQVEIASVEASSGFFPSAGAAQPDDAAASPRFNITARVANRHRNEQVSLRWWEADVSYAGVPLGAGSFPEICLEKMAEKEVTLTAATSTGLVGLGAEVRRRRAELESSSSMGGGLQLQIDMTLGYTVRRSNGRQIHSVQWLWCNATLLDGKSGPSSCHIYEYSKPPDLFSYSH